MTPADDFTHDDEHKSGEGDWISSEPPVDDFGDPSASEAATVSEGDEHAQEDFNPTMVEEKKKFPLLILLGAVGSLIIAGGLAYWHFSSRQDEETSILDMAAQSVPTQSIPHFASKSATPPAEVPPPVVPAAAPPSDVAPTTAFSAPSLTPEVPPTPKAISEAPPPQKTPAPTESMGAMTAQPTPSSPVENAMMAQPVATPATSQPATKAQPSAGEAERLDALSSRIDDLQKTLGTTTQQVSQINEKFSATPVSSDAATVERLNKLEQKLMQLEQAKTVSAPHAAPTFEDVIPSSTKKKAKHVVMSHKASSHATVSTPHEAKVEKKWVLRAATPDEAWISQGEEAKELRPVHAGDELPNVGKVISIRQVSDGWIVQGANGIIR